MNKYIYLGDNKIAPYRPDKYDNNLYCEDEIIEVVREPTHSWEINQILVEGVDFDKCVIAFGLTTRVWTYSEIYGAKYGCSECCNGDRCDEDCKAKYKGRRKDCPHCKGSGWIKKEDVEKEVAVPISKPNTDVANPVKEGERLYSKEDMIKAVQYGFWYATESQHHGEAPLGNIEQWLLYLSSPEFKNNQL